MPARPHTIRRLLGSGLAALLAFGLVACSDDSNDADADPTATDSDGGGDGTVDSDDLAVDEVWARATATGQSNGAIYLTIKGGDEVDRLTEVTLPAMGDTQAEIHETVAADLGGDGDEDHGDHGDHGAMTMRQVDEVEIPAGETVMFEPGGYHIMLLDLKAPLEDGDTIDVELTFAEAGTVKVTAEVRG